MITTENLATVARRLEEAGVDQGVFVGGSVIGLYLTDPLAPTARFTDDVDVVVPAATRPAYNRLEDNMRRAGHSPASEGPICRWVVDDIPVDLMPSDAEVLGFGNLWYPSLQQHAMEIELPSGVKVRVPSAPYLIATKIEAFKSRGREDYLGSRDIEDIVLIVDGREELGEEILTAGREVKRYLIREFRRMLREPGFHTALPGHMLPDEASQARAEIVLERMRRVAENR